MKQQYKKPQITVFSNDIGGQLTDSANSGSCLTYRDILSLVEDAFAEINGNLPATIEIKHQVLKHVSKNNFALALRTAIVGASKVTSPVAATIMDTDGVTMIPEIACGCAGFAPQTTRSAAM